jgi:predicted transport protein
MSTYLNLAGKLVTLREVKFDLERDAQKLTEQNLETIFGLKFVSGSLNKEFSVRAQEQDFYIDTLAFDEQQNSFVIIEYKKERSFSVIDQGFAYLAAMLNNKAEFVLELNEKLKKNFGKNDIDWEQSRLIFISPEFTNYQKNAINFKDLPFFLYEIRTYENGMVEFDPIKPYKSTASINSFIKDKIVSQVSKEVKVYSQEDLVKETWTNTKELLEEFENRLMDSGIETKVKYTKFYIAYMSKHGRNYVEVVPQQQGLKIYFRFPYDFTISPMNIGDCSIKGHWTNGISYIYLTEIDQVSEAIRLSSVSYSYLHKDVNDKA